MRNITGPPVEGQNFFGRKKELEYTWGMIDSGNNLIFPSPRRVGKTSFALKLLDKAKQEGWNTISINLEGISSEQDFIKIFIDKVKDLSWWQGVKDKGNALFDLVRQLKPSFSAGGVKVELDWKLNKEDIYQQLADLLNHNENTLVFADELTVLLTNIIENGEDGHRNVAGFLHWLRDIRIKAGSKIRWIYCSSVGIENFTHKHGLSDTMNDVHSYHLLPFSQQDSIDMLSNLGASNNVPLDDETKKAIIHKLGYCLPFFLQVIFEKIKYQHEIENILLTPDIAETAYRALIEENHFNTWVERIHEQYGDNKLLALQLLKHICQAKEGTRRDKLIHLVISSGLTIELAEDTVSLLLYMLKNDGYLIEEDGLYRFRSPLLRDFWFNRFIK
jgi:uncharacterized protein